MIEYKENYEYCFWNGIEINIKNSIEIFGIDFADYTEIEGKKIITAYVGEDFFYIIEADNLIDAIIIFLKSQSYSDSTYSYDNALDERHGFSIETKKTIINATEEFYEDIKNIRLLKDFPNINIEKCVEFTKEMNDYLKNIGHR